MHLYDYLMKFWLVELMARISEAGEKLPSSPWAGQAGTKLGSRSELERELLSHPEQQAFLWALLQ